MNVKPVMYSYLHRIKDYDLNTYFHCCRVASISDFIGQSIDLSPAERKNLYVAAHLHDVGKIQIPKSIISNPGMLNNMEWEMLKNHPALGADLLNQSLDIDIIKGINSHHERWDGEGYPYNLKGEDIPLVGRIIAIADAFDAMTSRRPYRSRMEFRSALSEIENCKGSQFDPYIVQHIVQRMVSLPLEEHLSRGERLSKHCL